MGDVLRNIFLLYLIGINICGVICMFVDKQKAIRDAWRIPERTLLMIAILGGGPGSYLGMYVFRHKTRHKSFVLGIPVIMILQILICCKIR